MTGPYLSDGQSPPLAVLYEDRTLIAVNKPAGLLFQGYTKSHPYPLDVLVKQHVRARKQSESGEIYLGIVHRLDRPVSGVVLFGLNSKFTGRLAEQFRQRECTKIYRTIVEGRWPEEEGQLIDDLPRLDDSGAECGDVQHCELTYRVVRRYQDATELEVKLGTGRRNQIRRQFSRRGHAVVGDTRYHARQAFPQTAGINPRYCPIALHAQRLEIAHPKTGAPLILEAPLPEYWDLARTIGLRSGNV